MRNGGKTIKGFEEFQKLSLDQQAYHIYMQVSKIDGLGDRYAAKWVEYFVKSLIVMVLVAVFGAIISQVVV